MAELNKEMSPFEICKDPNDLSKTVPFQKFSDLMKYLYRAPFEKLEEAKNDLIKRADEKENAMRLSISMSQDTMK